MPKFFLSLSLCLFISLSVCLSLFSFVHAIVIWTARIVAASSHWLYVWFRPILNVLASVIYDHKAWPSSVFVCVTKRHCYLNISLFIMYLNHVNFILCNIAQPVRSRQVTVRLGWGVGERDRQTDRQAGRQAGRQTETEREREMEREIAVNISYCTVQLFIIPLSFHSWSYDVLLLLFFLNLSTYNYVFN